MAGRPTKREQAAAVSKALTRALNSDTRIRITSGQRKTIERFFPKDVQRELARRRYERELKEIG